MESDGPPLPPELRTLAREIAANASMTIERRRIECGQPHDSVRAGVDWRRARWGVDLNVARYGEFILLEPRFRPATALLWGLPILALLVAVAVVVAAVTAEPEVLTERKPKEEAEDKKK